METETAIEPATGVNAPGRTTPAGTPSTAPGGWDGGPGLLRGTPDASSPAPPVAAAGPVDDRLTVRAWWDPDLARSGVDPRDEYVERFWLGLVGPSTVLLLRRLARGLDLHPAGFRVSLPDTARALGLGPGAGRNGPLNRTIDRACTFGLARRVGTGELLVRTHLPRLNRRQLARLPRVVRTAHEDWVRTRDAEATPDAGGTPDPGPPPTAA